MTDGRCDGAAVGVPLLGMAVGIIVVILDGIGVGLLLEGEAVVVLDGN